MCLPRLQRCKRGNKKKNLSWNIKRSFRG